VSHVQRRVTTALALLFSTAAAHGAELVATPLAEPSARHAAHVGLDAAFTTSPHGPTVDTFGTALRLAGDYHFENGVALTLDGGFVSESLAVEDDSPRHGVFPGNLLLGAAFERKLRAELDGALSLRVGAPLALYSGGIDDNRLAELAYTVASSAQGFREPFVWQMNVVPLVLGVAAAWHMPRWALLTAELSPSYLISVNQRPSRAALSAHLDWALQHGALIGHVGLNYFASTLPLENRDRDQLALRFGAAILVAKQRVGVDVSFGLDTPYGANQTDPHPWWGMALVVDSYFGPRRP